MTGKPRRRIPNPLNLTVSQLNLLDVILNNPSITIGHAALLTGTRPPACGRVMNNLTLHDLTHHEHNYSGVDGAWMLWPTEAGERYRKNNPEVFQALHQLLGLHS